MDLITKALIMAKQELRACYGKEGILAGLNQFRDYWARDSMFASLGCLEIGDYDIVKKNLILFLKNINNDGQVPLRVGKTPLNIALSYLGILSKKKRRKPIYNNDKSESKTVDQNSLLIIAAHEYIKTTRQYDFIKKNIHKFEKAMKWNFLNDKDKDLLVEENEYCNWADSVRKKGKVLYTNVCHCHALKCMSDMFKWCKDTKKSKHYLDLYKKVKSKINELFWTGEHYMDWVDEEKRFNYFATDGNMLAILWGIADEEKAKHIEETSHIYDINDVPSQCVHPNYRKEFVSPMIRFIGIGDYHNGLSWLWLGAINALGKNKVGMKKEARLLLEKMASLILEHKGVFEVYEKTGKPVSRLPVKSETPLAWSSGLFIYAVKEILG